MTKVTDLVFSGSLYMNGVFDLEIHHSLLGLPNAEIGDIRKVIGHPQVASLIGRHGFNMRARRGNTSSTWKQRGIFTGRTVRQCLRSSPGNVFG